MISLEERNPHALEIAFIFCLILDFIFCISALFTIALYNDSDYFHCTLNKNFISNAKYIGQILEYFIYFFRNMSSNVAALNGSQVYLYLTNLQANMILCLILRL